MCPSVVHFEPPGDRLQEMNRNAVVLIGIGQDELLGYAKQSIEPYCRKFNLSLEVITTANICIDKQDGYNYLTLEKNQVSALFEKYERILRLDCDALVTGLCPNVFDVVPVNKIAAVYEDIGHRWDQRHGQMELVAESFGGDPWGNRRYFNSGVILASRMHREIFMLTDKDMSGIREGNLGGCKEQNLLNWKVRELGFDVFELDYKYNHLSMFSGRWPLRRRRSKSYIIHYAGDQKRKLVRMKRDVRALGLMGSFGFC